MEPRNILAWNISETRRYILIRKMSQHIRISICDHMGFSGGLAVKNLPANAGDTGSIPGPGRPPGGENGIHSSILAGKSHGQRSLAGYSS